MRAKVVPVAMMVTGLWLAACGDIPQPFRHEGNSNPLARPNFEGVDRPEDEAHAPHRLSARLSKFEGFPGDGNGTLMRALRGALERRGVLVVREGGDVTVTPSVTVIKSSADTTRLEITWRVEGSGAKVLGQAKQQGESATSVVDHEWGRLAHDIAEGGADGIVQILQSAFTKRAGD